MITEDLIKLSIFIIKLMDNYVNILTHQILYRKLVIKHLLICHL